MKDRNNVSEIAGGYEYTYRWGGIKNIFSLIAFVGLKAVFVPTIKELSIGGTIFTIVVLIAAYYILLCFIINKTKFQLTATSLTASSHPLPFPIKSVNINPGEIESIQTTKFWSLRRFYKTEITTKDGNTDEIYMLWRNMKDGLHFENEVKTFLNITKEAAEDQTVK